MGDTAYMAIRASTLTLRDDRGGVRQIIRQRLVRQLRALVPEGRIHFSVVRQPPRTVEFVGLVGPKARAIAKRRREARRAYHGYLDFISLIEDRR